MSTHQTAALKALFVYYSKKSSPTGEYYLFKILLTDGQPDFCRMDAIHLSRVPWLMTALDQGKPVYAPVVKDLKAGYRIDLTALEQFDPAKAQEPPVRLTAPVRAAAPSAKTRIQINIEPAKYEALCRLAEAEGFKTYSDWLRAVIDRVLDAARV